MRGDDRQNIEALREGLQTIVSVPLSSSLIFWYDYLARVSGKHFCSFPDE